MRYFAEKFPTVVWDWKEYIPEALTFLCDEWFRVIAISTILLHQRTFSLQDYERLRGAGCWPEWQGLEASPWFLALARHK